MTQHILLLLIARAIVLGGSQRREAEQKGKNAICESRNSVPRPVTLPLWPYQESRLICLIAGSSAASVSTGLVLQPGDLAVFVPLSTVNRGSNPEMLPAATDTKSLGKFLNVILKSGVGGAFRRDRIESFTRTPVLSLALAVHHRGRQHRVRTYVLKPCTIALQGRSGHAGSEHACISGLHKYPTHQTCHVTTSTRIEREGERGMH